jgi:ribonuclease G
MSENLIVINADFGETRVAIVEHGIIVELLVERVAERSIIGNIYCGKVMRVLPGMQAAFVDIGLERNAFLHVSDLIPFEEYEHFGEVEAEKNGGESGKRKSRHTPIQDIIREGALVPVQVSKGPISTKGARVTAHVSLPGRHLVYMPASDRGGVSRRILDDSERRRLAKVLKAIAPEHGALIARTVAEGVSADALAADAAYLSDIWNNIYQKYVQRKKPCLLYEELDLPLRVARDRLNDTVTEFVIDNKVYYDKLYSFVDRLMPNKLDALNLYKGDEPIFDAFGIETEIRRALDRRVSLPSGGYLVIDQTEALTAIDVNTGKFIGKGSKDPEQTILTTNLEAVDEIVYQLRFRNIGGLIVLDLIDMDRLASRRKVLGRLKEVLRDDRAKASVIRISEFGLVEMTRQRTSDSLGRTLHESCSYCDGTGHVLSRVTVANEALREVRRRYDEFRGDIELGLHPNVAEVFQGECREPLRELEKRIGKKVMLKSVEGMHQESFDVRAYRPGNAVKEAL